jgi:hypothetical protein
MSKPLSSPVARIACAAALALGGLGSAATALAAEDPIGSDHFVQGWQSQTHALINRGASTQSGRPAMTIWRVPANLPRGHYVVVNRQGDKAELIEGYGFDINSTAYRDVNVVLPMGYGYVEALPERFVPDAKRVEGVTRFEGR